MKRTPLKRTTPLRRDGAGARKFADQRSELKRTGGLARSELKRSGRLNPRSDKREKLYAEDRRPYIDQLAKAGVGCEIGPMLADKAAELAEKGVSWRCAGTLDGLHERRKRSAGGSLVARENLVPACNLCNGLVEDEPRVIRELFGDALVLRESDPDYHRLGVRADKE